MVSATALKWEEVAPLGSAVVCVGDIGTGKSAIMASRADYSHAQKRKVVYVAPPEALRGYPKWVKGIKPEQVENLAEDTDLYVDDAHLYFYARESMSGSSKVKGIDFVGRERRHRNQGVFVNSQQSRVIDINILSMVDCILIKKPSLMQIRFARPQFRPYLNAAQKHFENMEKEEAVKYVYVVTGELEEFMTNTMPAWFTDEASKSYARTNLKKPYSVVNRIGNLLRSFA